MSEDLIKKCKEGNIQGIFGYPTKYEELAEKYSVDPELIDEIMTEYGSIDNLYELLKLY